MAPDRRMRLSSWRSVTGITTLQKEQQDAPTPAVLHFRSQQSQLRTLLLETIAELDRTYEVVNAYLAQTERPLEHAKYLEEKTAYVLETYERAVSQALSRAQSNVLLDLPYEREVVRRVYVPQPQEESLLQRLFGL